MRSMALRLRGCASAVRCVSCELQDSEHFPCGCVYNVTSFAAGPLAGVNLIA